MRNGAKGRKGPIDGNAEQVGQPSGKGMAILFDHKDHRQVNEV